MKIQRKSLFISIYIALVFVIFCANPLNAQLDPNVRDLDILTEWFEGEFDNDSQVWFEARSSYADDQKHGRVHMIHTKIAADSIGKHVFYVEEYMDDDPRNITRQRIVSFFSSGTEKGVIMAIHFLKDAKKYAGAYKTPEVFEALKKEDLFGLDGCDVIFKRVGEQYHGSMASKACQFGEGKLKRYSVHDMTISKNQYWRVDRSFLVKNDKFHAGHPTDEPHKMRRATVYDCEVNFYVKSYAEPDPDDVEVKGLKIHNQGGFAWVTYPKDGQEYGIQLREKEYPFYDKGISDFFMMRFIQKGKKRSNVIVTTEPGVKKISFNSGWASCYCKKISKE